MADSTNIWASTRHADAGTFYSAPLGTTLPTTATATLDAAFDDHGWLGEEGITNSMTRDTTKHKSFGGDTVKVTQDNYEETIQVTLLESNPTVLATVFGEDNVTVDDSGGHRTIQVDHDSAMLPRKTFVVRVIDGVKTRLILVEEGQVTSVDDIVHVHSDLLAYTITVDVFKPASGNKAVRELIDEPDVLAGS
jgi:hypothetical protein